MKKSMVLAVLLSLIIGYGVLAEETDYTTFEGGRWQCRGYVFSLRHQGGTTLVDITLTIDRIGDGKIEGTYVSKVKGEKPVVVPFTSKILTTPEGLLRLGFRGSTGYDLWYDLQKDGSMKSSSPGGPVLQRVTE